MENIILIGYMGCGKTTTGKNLARICDMEFLDTDEEIEKQQGRTISDIFAKEGEDAFRDMETGLLQELLQKQGKPKVISTGGGMPVRERNRQLLHKLGMVVYLNASPETVYERVKEDTKRPLLQCENPLQKICQMQEQRGPYYEQAADHIICVDKTRQSEVAETIKQLYDKRRGMKILVINGPNINFLGIREKGIYGTQDYAYLLDMIQKKAKESGCEIETFQSNHEGAIIDRIQEAYYDKTEGIVINPGAYTHYSYAIHDALASITIPKVEIHISDITQREEFRKVSVTKAACNTQIYGRGLDGYLMAIDYLLELKENQASSNVKNNS